LPTNGSRMIPMNACAGPMERLHKPDIGPMAIPSKFLFHQKHYAVQKTKETSGESPTKKRRAGDRTAAKRQGVPHASYLRHCAGHGVQGAGEILGA
jgi:hypothetical protein